MLQGKKAEKCVNNVTEDVICDKIFIMKILNKEHDRKKCIVDSSATSHMINSEENMTNLKNTETRVTVGDSRTLTGTYFF